MRDGRQLNGTVWLGIIGGLMVAENLGDVHDEIRPAIKELMAKKIIPQELCLICGKQPCECGSKQPDTWWCEIHQHFKPCEHNGGVRADDGSWKEKPDAPPQDSGQS